jgi:SAM-dependent methyltransferase
LRHAPVDRAFRISVATQEDLRDLVIPPLEFDVLILADFLQHLPGGRAQREQLLASAIAALRPNGVFYLSCFNLNIKHYLKGDVHGDFAGGDVRYERMSPENVAQWLPDFAAVSSVRPMTVVYSPPALDRMLSRLPFAKLFARWLEVTGCRRADG